MKGNISPEIFREYDIRGDAEISSASGNTATVAAEV